MDIENQGERTSLSTVVTSSNHTCLDVDAQSEAQLKDMSITGDDNSPKARKPYTITKQRERWTEEEHKKFLEALKLYGRAWRRIEEHIGTKTAVQIRSHAQKFFSKVVRETNNDQASPVKPIEIPPPRPKRKPMHPYPRKQVQNVSKRISASKQVERSPSPNSSGSEQENQSPKSVLSAVRSDTLGSTISNSSADIAKHVSFLAPAKDNRYESSTSLTEEENGSPSILGTSASTVQEQSSMKSDVGSDNSTSKAITPTLSLKLFGRTVLVTDSHRPSSSLAGTGKPLAAEESHHESSDTDESEPVQTHQQNLKGGVYSIWPQGNPTMFYQMQNPNPVEGSSVVPMPWWPLQGGLPFHVLPSFNLNQPEIPPNASHREDSEESDLLQDKEGSSTGSSASSGSEVGTSDKSADVVTDFNNQELELELCSSDKNPSHGFVLKPSKRSAFSLIRANPTKYIKGFVPYKRFLAEREEDLSSTIVAEERDGQRIRLCL